MNMGSIRVGVVSWDMGSTRVGVVSWDMGSTRVGVAMQLWIWVALEWQCAVVDLGKHQSGSMQLWKW